MVSRTRASLVSALALAGLAAGLIASWPAAAKPSQTARSTAAPQTQNRFFFHDGPEPIEDGGGTIAHVTLPKGNWMVTAKLWVDHSAPWADIFVACGLSLGSGPVGLGSPAAADGDNAAFVAPAKADGVIAGVLTMTASHVFTSPGIVNVACQDLGTNAQYHQLRIQAVKVGSIVRTGI